MLAEGSSGAARSALGLQPELLPPAPPQATLPLGPFVSPPALRDGAAPPPPAGARAGRVLGARLRGSDGGRGRRPSSRW